MDDLDDISHENSPIFLPQTLCHGVDAVVDVDDDVGF